MSEKIEEIRIVPTGSGFIIYWGDDIHPASTAFICNKIVSKLTRRIEEDSGMRDHELSAGRLNFKGASKEKVENKIKSEDPESGIIKVGLKK